MNASTPNWSTESPNGAEESESGISSVLAKETLVKDIVQTQQGLAALLNRVAVVQGESTKLKESNAVLQTYIDNLTRTNAASR